jgi:hypothetical protein
MINCRICNEKEEGEYMNPTMTEMVVNKLCFTCNFWNEKLQIAGEPHVARIDGKHYVVGPVSDSQWKGSGGHKFTIKFHDGRVVITTNLWSQGEIPEIFKERLKDNAVFLEA